MILPPTRDELLTKLMAGWQDEEDASLNDMTVVARIGRHDGGRKQGTGKKREKVVHTPKPGEVRFKDFVLSQAKKMRVSIYVVHSWIYAGRYNGLNKRREGHACFVMANAKLRQNEVCK